MLLLSPPLLSFTHPPFFFHVNYPLNFISLGKQPGLNIDFTFCPWVSSLSRDFCLFPSCILPSSFRTSLHLSLGLTVWMFSWFNLLAMYTNHSWICPKLPFSVASKWIEFEYHCQKHSSRVLNHLSCLFPYFPLQWAFHMHLLMCTLTIFYLFMHIFLSLSLSLSLSLFSSSSFIHGKRFSWVIIWSSILQKHQFSTSQSTFFSLLAPPYTSLLSTCPLFDLLPFCLRLFVHFLYPLSPPFSFRLALLRFAFSSLIYFI